MSAIQKLYPQALADKSWDNTGLLLESPERADLAAARPARHVVLLTIDLTRAVVDEAIALRSAFIVTYHPIIFRGLKALTLGEPQQESLLRLAQAGISVYSPHTAVDAAVGGVNDWLAAGISGGAAAEASRDVIAPVAAPAGFEGAGMGRMVVLREPAVLGTLVDRVKRLVGMERVMVVDGSGGRAIERIAVCAGSGGSLFKGVKADLLFTGELSHHEVLAAKEQGVSVISCECGDPKLAVRALTVNRLPHKFGAWVPERGDEGKAHPGTGRGVGGGRRQREGGQGGIRGGCQQERLRPVRDCLIQRKFGKQSTSLDCSSCGRKIPTGSLKPCIQLRCLAHCVSALQTRILGKINSRPTRPQRRCRFWTIQKFCKPKRRDRGPRFAE